MQEYSLSDIAAASGGNRNNGGFGDGDGALWIILLIALFGGFGNNRGGFGGNGGYAVPYGAGMVGGNELYPWLNNSQNINDGFRDQMLQTNVQGVQQSIAALSQQLCGCCGDMQMAVANGFAGTNANVAAGFAGVNAGMAAGFAGIEAGANARQMANMERSYAVQTATTQGINGLQAQLSDCCCENRLATANQTATILAEHCSDRAAISDGIRDIIAAQSAGTQRILDQMCADKIDAKNDEIAQLRTQIQVQNLAASQNAQTAAIIANNEAQTSALEQYLAPVPRPAYVVQNPNCCGQTYGCGCAA